MSKNRVWVCDTCKTYTIKVRSKRVKEAMFEHRKVCQNATSSMENARGKE